QGPSAWPVPGTNAPELRLHDIHGTPSNPASPGPLVGLVAGHARYERVVRRHMLGSPDRSRRPFKSAPARDQPATLLTYCSPQHVSPGPANRHASCYDAPEACDAGGANVTETWAKGRAF